MGRDLKDFGLWCKAHFGPYIKKISAYIQKSWKSLVVIVPTLIVLYYGIGSLYCEKIDKNLQFEQKNQTTTNSVFETMSRLITREIDKHMYTPNLPFVFPAYILDNMPAFQSGIMLSLSDVVHEIALQATDENLKKADELLSYPLDVWLFSKTKDFKLEPSSTAQYRKAKQFLLKVPSHVLSDPNIVLDAVAHNLIFTEKELNEAMEIKKFRKADDAFYKAQGRLYTSYVLLKAIEQEYHILFDDVYQALEKGVVLDPLIIRNGNSGSSFSPNHLLELAYLTLKSEKALKKVIKNHAHRN